MRTLSCTLIVCGVLFSLSLSLHLSADATLAAPPPLMADAAHRVTSGPIFKPGEQIAFWYDVVTGGAGGFANANSVGLVHANDDGALDVTISATDWQQIPKTATALVAHGFSSGVDAVLPLQVPADLDLSLHIDANHRITSGPVFSPGERVVFWYNLPGGTATAFLTEGFQVVEARSDGSIDTTIPNADWRLPAEATSVVAHGLISNVSIVYIVPTK